MNMAPAWQNHFFNTLSHSTINPLSPLGGFVCLAKGAATEIACCRKVAGVVGAAMRGGETIKV